MYFPKLETYSRIVNNFEGHSSRNKLPSMIALSFKKEFIFRQASIKIHKIPD